MNSSQRGLALLQLAWLIVAVTACRPSSSDVEACWSGDWRYEGPALEGAGGVIIAETIVLHLDASGGCRIERFGRQLDEAMICEQVPTAGGLDLLFLHYVDGKLINDYGVAAYAVREPLLSLRGQRDSASPSVAWGTLMPDAGATGSFGQFRRSTPTLGKVDDDRFLS